MPHAINPRIARITGNGTIRVRGEAIINAAKLKQGANNIGIEAVATSFYPDEKASANIVIHVNTSQNTLSPDVVRTENIDVFLKPILPLLSDLPGLPWIEGVPAPLGFKLTGER